MRDKITDFETLLCTGAHQHTQHATGLRGVLMCYPTS